MFAELSRAVDFFNENRVESEQITFGDALAEINNPFDEKEVMRLIIELYQD